jgi:hypothetical protein
MSVFQSRADSNSFPVILHGMGFIKDNETLLTDAARTVPLAQFTVMSQIASTGKWVPWVSNTLTDTTGKALPLGILMSNGGVTAAALATADVTGAQIMHGGDGCALDYSQLVLDRGSTGVLSANTFTTPISVGQMFNLTAEAFLALRGMFLEPIVALDNLEN